MSFTNKTVVITGDNNEIGKSTAEEFSQENTE